MADVSLAFSPWLSGAIVPVIVLVALVLFAADAGKRRRETNKLREELESMRAMEEGRQHDLLLLRGSQLDRRRARISLRFLAACALLVSGVAWSVASHHGLITLLASQDEAIEGAYSLLRSAERQINQLAEQNRTMNLQLISVDRNERPAATSLLPPDVRSAAPRPKQAGSRASVRSRETAQPSQATTGGGANGETVAPDLEKPPSSPTTNMASTAEPPAPRPVNPPPRRHPAVDRHSPPRICSKIRRETRARNDDA